MEEDSIGDKDCVSDLELTDINKCDIIEAFVM